MNKGNLILRMLQNVRVCVGQGVRGPGGDNESYSDFS